MLFWRLPIFRLAGNSNPYISIAVHALVLLSSSATRPSLDSVRLVSCSSLHGYSEGAAGIMLGWLQRLVGVESWSSWLELAYRLTPSWTRPLQKPLIIAFGAGHPALALTWMLAWILALAYCIDWLHCLQRLNLAWASPWREERERE